MYAALMTETDEIELLPRAPLEPTGKPHVYHFNWSNVPCDLERHWIKRAGLYMNERGGHRVGVRDIKPNGSRRIYKGDNINLVWYININA